MVEASLVSELLAAEIVEFGKLLLRRLDARHSSIRAAYWMRVPENGAWSLFLSSPKLKTAGPRMLYGEIIEALQQTSAGKGHKGVPLDTIRLVSPQDEMPTLLRRLIRTGPTTIGSYAFSRTTINGTLIPDCYIYRSS